MERGGNSVVARRRGGELTSRNVAARIGSKVETRVRLDCHPESILITATSQPLFLRRCTTVSLSFSLSLPRQGEEFASLRIEIDGLAFREILLPAPSPNERTNTLPPPVVEALSSKRFVRSRDARRGRRKIFAKLDVPEENSALVFPIPPGIGIRGGGASFNPPPSRMLDDQQSIKA